MKDNLLTEKELLEMINSLVSLPEVQKPKNRKDDSLLQHDGWIQVKDNQIQVMAPKEEGHYPCIQPEAPLRLWKNGKEVTKPELVTPHDRLEWSVEPSPLFSIQVSKDKMMAFLTLHSLHRYSWQLVDQVPSLHVTLKAKEDPTCAVHTLKVNEILHALQEKGIICGVNKEVIQQELRNPTFKATVIAEGMPAIHGKDGWLQLLIAQEEKRNHLEEVNGRINFRNHLHIPSAKKGDKIAKKHPPQEGQAGWNLYLDPIPCRPAGDIVVVSKGEVEITLDGEVIALKDGRPRITGGRVKFFDICPSYEVMGGVSIATGNVSFSGDVIVHGNVLEGMSIEALGSVYVYGGCYGAVISATGNIQVQGNIIRSQLYAGYFGVLFNLLYQSTKSLHQHILSLTETVELLQQASWDQGKVIRVGHLILTLIETKFPDLRRLTQEWMMHYQAITQLQLTQNGVIQEAHKLYEALHDLLHPARTLELRLVTQLKSLSTQAEGLYASIERLQEEEAKIEISRSQQSTLKSNGNIMIKKGILQSELHTKKDIIFSLHTATCRGGRLQAEGSIHAAKVEGLGTTLQAGKEITANRLEAGRIIIGTQFKDIFEPMTLVRVFLDEEGKLKLKGKKADPSS